MIPFKFTPEMFDRMFQDGVGTSEMDAAANLANEALQAEISKWVKVWGYNYGGNFWCRTEKLEGDTHFAYLTPPQLIEVEECKHEPEVDYINNRRVLREKCMHCGEPLIATWTLAEAKESK